MRALRAIIILNILLWGCYAVAWLSGTSDAFGTLFALDADPAMLLRHPWTLLTYMALHSSPLHLLLNMACLVFFGYILCKEGVSGRTLVLLYICGGMAGGFLYLGFGEDTLAGASASVLAVTAFSGTRCPKNRVNVGTVRLPYVAVLASMALAGALCASGSTGALAAHIGGALTGGACALFFQRLAAQKSPGPGDISPVIAPEPLPCTPVKDIMEKVRVSGFNSLTYSERRALADAPDNDNMDRK